MKSYSEKRYCIAGIDAKSGEWIRLVREDGQPIKKEDITYHNDNNEVEVLDIIEVCLKDKKPFRAQPGNYIYQSENYIIGNKPVKIGKKSSILEVLPVHPIENRNLILYNNEKKVSPDEIKNTPEKDRYSLTLINVKNVIIYKKEYEYNNGEDTRIKKNKV